MSDRVLRWLAIAAMLSGPGCHCEQERMASTASSRDVFMAHVKLPESACDLRTRKPCIVTPTFGPVDVGSKVLFQTAAETWEVDLVAPSWRRVPYSQKKDRDRFPTVRSEGCTSTRRSPWAYCYPRIEEGLSVHHEVIAKRLLIGTIHREGSSPVTLEPVMLERKLNGRRFVKQVLDIEMAHISNDGRLYAALFDDPDGAPWDPDGGDLGVTIWVVIWRLDGDEGKLARIWTLRASGLTTHYDFARFVGERYFVALLDAHLHVFDLKNKSTWAPCTPAQSSIARLPEAGVDDVRGLFLTQTVGRAQLVSLCPGALTKDCCRFIDLPDHGTKVGSNVRSVALSRDGIGAAVDDRGEVVLFDTRDDGIATRSRRTPPGPLDDLLWFSREGRWLFYLNRQGLDILSRATGKWLTLVPLRFDSPGLLVLDDQGHVDGDPEVLERIAFLVGDRTVVGLDGVKSVGAKSPHVPGLLRRFVSADEAILVQDGGAN